MSSREIAELVESRPEDVKRSIERLAERGVIAHPPMACEQFTDKLGRPREAEVYLICKRDSYVVVAQLSPEFTARLVDRWQELEQGLSSPVPQTFSEALRLAADLEEQKQKLTEALSAAAPKVEFVDRYCSARGSMSFRQVAKLLNAKEPEFRLFLLDKNIMYRLGGALTPHHQHTSAGRFEVKTGTSINSNHAFSQARFTPKGVKWVAGLWAEYQQLGGLA